MTEMNKGLGKRLLCGLLSLMLLTGIAPALAEEEEAVSEAELEEILALDEVDESAYNVTGKVWHEKTKEDFTPSSPALYRAKLSSKYSIFAEKSIESKRLYKPTSDSFVDILYVGLTWLITRHGSDIGYSKREWIAKSTIEAYDPVNTPPLNAQKHAYIATTATTCHVRKTMDLNTSSGDDGNNWVILKPGTRLSIWQFYDGWAMVNYMRSYGYIDPNELTDLIPVSPTDERLYEDSPIAAYTSYYKMVQTETNINRIHNIKMGCSYISRTLQPGELFDANAIMGPYNPRKGYEKAGVLVEGTTVAGYGGGALSWISGHWLLLAAVILIGGTVIDLAVYLFRWRPDIVWRSYFRRLRGEGVEAVPYGETPEPERVSRKWLYADGTTEDVTDWVEDEPADEWLEPEDLSQLRYEDDSLPEEDGYTSPDGYPEPADDEAPAGAEKVV